MDQTSNQWSKLVYRVRGLPNATQSREDVSDLLSKRFGDIPADSIHVFSLATTLNVWEKPPSKVATVMFTTPPGLFQKFSENEWSIPSQNDEESLIMDTNFMGMTPMNDVDSSQHVSE
jgi:hypothetical protein